MTPRINHITGLLSLTHLLSLTLLVLVIIPTGSQARHRTYPGKLIDIGSHSLHINCIGHGSPTVIIDSGIGGFSLEWIEVQKKLAGNVRVCSYDRAGYGWSEPGPRPRTSARIAYELRKLLHEARIPGPYVLVGHSFGGYNIRYFASSYPELTAGMILVDASHHDQFNTEEFKRIDIERQEHKPRYKNSVRVRIVHPIIADNYPLENRRTAYVLMTTTKAKSTLINELDYMPLSAEQVSAHTNHPPYKFPVTILTRGKRVWPHDEMGERREMQWLRLQHDLEKISIQSRHYLAKDSGHIIHLDQPDLVAMNIRRTVDEVRTIQHELALAKKYDVRLPEYSRIIPFSTTSKTFEYDDDDFYQSFPLIKYINQAMFELYEQHGGEHSKYILR